MRLSIVCSSPQRLEQARACAAGAGLSVVEQAAPEDDYVLLFDADAVRLQVLAEQGKQRRRGKVTEVWVDFAGGAAAHRRKFGGGKGQMIAKAVGLKSGVLPSVYDLTAGLGGDAFVLASLGCQVTLLERNPVVHALLADGLCRARQYAEEQDEELLRIVKRMHLLAGNSVDWLREAESKPSVIYLDPMFPERRKSASVKKEMQAFHDLVGADDDADTLLNLALEVAEHRVVVKRPRIAPALGAREPMFTLEGKSSRFDIYALKNFSK